MLLLMIKVLRIHCWFNVYTVVCDCRREGSHFVIIKVGTTEETEGHENHQHLWCVGEKERERTTQIKDVCV